MKENRRTTKENRGATEEKEQRERSEGTMRVKELRKRTKEQVGTTSGKDSNRHSTRSVDRRGMHPNSLWHLSHHTFWSDANQSLCFPQAHSPFHCQRRSCRKNSENKSRRSLCSGHQFFSVLLGITQHSGSRRVFECNIIRDIILENVLQDCTDNINLVHWTAFPFLPNGYLRILSSTRLQVPPLI